jgi:hypothetical protein
MEGKLKMGDNLNFFVKKDDLTFLQMEHNLFCLYIEDDLTFVCNWKTTTQKIANGRLHHYFG